MPSGSAPIRAASGRVFVGDAVTPTELPDDKPQSGLCKCNPCATGVGVLVCSQLSPSTPLGSGPHFCDFLWLILGRPGSVSSDLPVHQGLC